MGWWHEATRGRCIENKWAHMWSRSGAKFMRFCPQNDKSTRFDIILLFNTPSHAYSAGHDRFSGTQNKYFKGIPVSLTLRKFLYLVILKKFQSSQSFLPCFNMDFYGDRPKQQQRIISAFWFLRSPISQALCERSIDRIPDLLSDINTNLISYPTPLFDIKTAIWTSPTLNLLHKI